MLLWLVGVVALLVGLFLHHRFSSSSRISSSSVSELKEVAELFRIKPRRTVTKENMEDRAGFVWNGSEWISNDNPQINRTDRVTIYSQNIWFAHERQMERAQLLLDEIREQHATVVALQEVQQHVLDVLLRDNFVRQNYAVSNLALVKGYAVVLFVLRSYSAGFSELPLPTQMGRTAIFGHFHCGRSVATVHLESLENADVRAEQADAIFNIGKPDVLIGDCNCDASWNEDLEDVVAKHAMRDAWGVERGGGFTRNGKRIDRAFLSQRFRTVEMEVLSSRKISDHFGILVPLAAVEPK